MASDERTEDPTPRRYEEARSRGQVARSLEINSAVLLLAGFLVLQSWSGQAIDDLTVRMRGSLQQTAVDDLTPQLVYNLMVDSGLVALRALAPILAVLLVVGIVANVAQTRFLLTAQPLLPDLSRINPLAGFKRIFSTRSLVELAKALAKCAIISLVVYRSFLDHFPQMMVLAQADLRLAAATLGRAALAIGIDAGVALLVLGALDYLYQRREYLVNLRMSRDDVKQELRQTEGSPELRARVRQIQRQLSHGRSLHNVPHADVVVVNPIHYAVALEYKPAEMRAPRVVAKGRGLIAQRIRQIAAEARIPVVANPPLAQALYRLVEIGQEIPTDLYQAVAELMAFIFSLRGGTVGSRA